MTNEESQKVPFVDLKAQYLEIKTEIDSAIRQVLDQTAFIGGQEIRKFEENFQKVLGISHCIAVGNGTDAIYIALKMCGIKPGDEVITTATSWISTSETISQAGAKPVFVDIDPITYTIDPDQIEAKITARTRAIIPVHLYGQAAHIENIRIICDQHNLFLIEDCAQSHLTEEKGRYVGTFGHVATFSFYPGKNLGAYGDAGAIVTNDTELAEKMRMYANHGALIKHQHLIEGLNSRLDTIQAAVLNQKLPRLQHWTEKRIANAAIYNRHLQGIGPIVLPHVRKDTVHSFHLYVIKCAQRDALKNFLESHGIQTAIHYPVALPNMPAYAYLNHSREDFPIASKHQDEILSLPMYPELTEEQIIYVTSTIKRFFNI